MYPNVPKDCIAARGRTEQIHLELSGAARAEVEMKLSAKGLTRRQRMRHELVQIDGPVQRVKLVALAGLTEDMTTARAPDDSLSP